jgi:hypothetical protein
MKAEVQIKLFLVKSNKELNCPLRQQSHCAYLANIFNPANIWSMWLTWKILLLSSIDLEASDFLIHRITGLKQIL